MGGFDTPPIAAGPLQQVVGETPVDAPKGDLFDDADDITQAVADETEEIIPPDRKLIGPLTHHAGMNGERLNGFFADGESREGGSADDAGCGEDATLPSAQAVEGDFSSVLAQLIYTGDPRDDQGQVLALHALIANGTAFSELYGLYLLKETIEERCLSLL